MTTLREAAQAVVDAFADPNARGNLRGHWLHISDCVAALRAALEQPEQEPSVCARCGGLVFDPVWVAQSDPPRREWQSLTEEDIALIDWESMKTKRDAARAIEQALKERNQ